VNSKAITPSLQGIGPLAVRVGDAIFSEPFGEHRLGTAIRAESSSIHVQLASGPRLEDVDVELNVVSDQLICCVDDEKSGL